MSWDTAMALDLALARGGYECERCGDQAAPRPRSLCWPCEERVRAEDEEARWRRIAVEPVRRHRGPRCRCCGGEVRPRGGCDACRTDPACQAMGCWTGDDGDNDDDRRRDGAGRT